MAQPEQAYNPLETVLLQFTPVDVWTGLDACEGTVIFGSPGSGKTSTSGKRILRSFLQAGMGGLCLVAKGEETANLLNAIHAEGRKDDVIVFSAHSGHRFDPIFYTWNRPGRSAADTEALIETFTTLMAVGRNDEGHSKDPFWEMSNEKLMRNTIKLLALAGAPMSIYSMNQVITTLPTQPGEADSEEWLRKSFCALMLQAAGERQRERNEGKPDGSEDAPEDLDLLQVENFLLEKWPRLAKETSSSIEMQWATMADKFLFDPYRTLFCSGKCTFIPEQTVDEGKIIIVDFPALEYGEATGRIINCMLKLVFQRAWLRRDISENGAMAFLWADEFQYFVTRLDNLFQQTCRSARIATVYLTQNILNLSERLGEFRPGSKTKAFLGNLMLKIFHQQNDPDTNQYAADLIGKEYQFLRHVGMERKEARLSQSEQLLYKLEPDLFSRLRKPDTRNPVAETYIYQGGKAFRSMVSGEYPEGRNFAKVAFSR